jgi:hypothetical protein
LITIAIFAKLFIQESLGQVLIIKPGQGHTPENEKLTIDERIIWCIA